MVPQNLGKYLVYEGSFLLSNGQGLQCFFHDTGVRNDGFEHLLVLAPPNSYPQVIPNSLKGKVVQNLHRYHYFEKSLIAI